MDSLRAGFAQLKHFLLIYTGALSCGIIGNWLNLPLPYMIGALIFAACLRLSNLPVMVPMVTRAIGQMIVASSVGLSFTPTAVAALSALFFPMIGAAILTVIAGFAVAAILMRLARVDVITAILSSIPMGPVESANLANRHGVAAGPVILSQTLRIMILVIFIPPVLVSLSDGIHDPVAALRAIPWTPTGAALLICLGMVGGLVAHALRFSNPFFIGSIAGAALATALNFPVTAYPYPFLVIAQIFLGVWLGAAFDRDLLQRAGRLLPAAVVSSLVMVSICVGMGLGLAWMTDQDWAVMILSTAPGSVTEMVLTAKILKEGIAVVTAFHLVRIFIILSSASLIISLTARLATLWGLNSDIEK